MYIGEGQFLLSGVRLGQAHLPASTPCRRWIVADTRDVLQVLKFELSFLEQGGYGRSVRTPWKATSAFQDSLTCLNYGEPERPHPCNECLLYAFVPDHSRNETVPCHHIPLNDHGDTLESVDRGYNQVEIEDKLRTWLRATIQKLEEEQKQQQQRERAASASSAATP